MARRGGTWPGWLAALTAAVLGATAGAGQLDDILAAFVKSGPSHGVHVPTIQSRVPSLPSIGAAKGGRYSPGVCHPNDEAPASDAQIDRWITQAGALLHRPYTASERAVIHVVIDHESFGGKVHAINCWDSNWRNGHPSMGLIQAIDSTYMAHAPAGCRQLAKIYDPPCNIAAGTAYAIGRYGSIEAIPGARRVQAGDDYIGY